MLLLSIHPKYANLILSGEKQVELRRQMPRMRSGCALVYATVPEKQLVGSFQIVSVVQRPLNLLWQMVREKAVVTRDEFDSYFAGLSSGVAINITCPIRFRKAISLDQLRATWPGFHPPQGFRYLSPQEIEVLNISELKKAG